MIDLLLISFMSCAQATKIVESMTECCDLPKAELEEVKADLRQHLTDKNCPVLLDA